MNLLAKQKFTTASSEIKKDENKRSSKPLKKKIYIVELNEIFKEEEKKKL